MTTRRNLLVAALATGIVVPLGAGRASAAPDRAGLPRLTLPRPTGPHRIGSVALHLVDRSRPDPVAGAGHHRSLMATVCYPAARDDRRYPAAPWLSAAATHALLVGNEFPADVVAAPLTAGQVGAPVLRDSGRRPVIVYSHGNNSHRGEATIVVQQLVSHGYVVVSIDHTYDAYSELSNGRLTVPEDELEFTPWDSAYDMRFLLDRLEDLAAGRNPDAGRRQLPAGLGAVLDLRRIGMAGWSKGATSTAIVLNQDRRVRAGLALDGPMQAVPPPDVVDRPFMMMTAEFTRVAEPSVEDFWRHYLTGWKLNVQADGAAHSSYCDHQWLLPQLAQAIGMSDEELAGWVGTLDPGRGVRIQQAYPLAFFDLHLRNRRQRLLEGPSAAFPEVQFLP
ncbi:alpha/beta hydrolase family protein [Paractinoplanes rishiriensis]|uniref:Lipase n=1 Tax=Paractinoplanes rishiriensis TaxID=1050105 RepID=A0A919K4Q7_9ACTN|nr:acetylhydrolase [Actinoplanes rishiriensis]GIE99272.1 lipase [Actinoplanes rishiriensis]